MAIKKSITTSSNTVASYWNIVGVYANRLEKFVEIQLAGYVDEATRRAAREDGSAMYRPLESATQKLVGADYTAVTIDGPAPSYETIYRHLMTLPVWEDAVAV